jgi:hypothetical protein
MVAENSHTYATLNVQIRGEVMVDRGEIKAAVQVGNGGDTRWSGEKGRGAQK